MTMRLTTHWTEIRQLSSGEQPGAWQGFVERYRGFVESALRRMIWSTDRAQDATDEFWAYLFQSDVLARLQPPMRFRAFLSGTLRNYALDWLRRNTQRRHVILHDAHVAPEPDMPEREELALWGHQLLHLALQRLERAQPRWAMALRRFYGLGEDVLAPPAPRTGAWDLAMALGLANNPLNALHQLLFRARRGLRECLTEEVRQTVSTRPDLREELTTVFAVLGTSIPGLLEADPS